MPYELYDVIVIGGGPGGYVAAIKSAQLGFKTACIDQRDTLGGTCLNVGCIPSKALLYSSHLYYQTPNELNSHGINITSANFDLKKMFMRKDKIVRDLAGGINYLFKKNGVTFIKGTGSFTADKKILVGNKLYQAKHIIIATGSQPITLPGIEIDERTIVSSTGALSLKSVPRHLIVIGGGYIGLELGSVWHRLGAIVTVVEFSDRITPTMDNEIAQSLYMSLRKQGLQFIFNTKVEKVIKVKDSLKVNLTNVINQSQTIIDCDVVLSCVGRKPAVDKLQLAVLGIKCETNSCIIVDENFKTNVDNIYAIGDVIKGPMLAHKAEEEGIACIEMIAGQKPYLNKNNIPAVIYTQPEAASVGQTEQQLISKKVNYKVGKFSFNANARALCSNTTEGYVKILTDSITDEILGIHIIHAEAGTLISEATLAMEYRASAEDIARTIHAHPTLNEALREAAMAAYDKPIHL